MPQPPACGAPTAPGASRRRRTARTLRRELPLLPAVLMLLAFMAGPIAYAFYGAFTNRTMSGHKAVNPDFIGVDNYVSLLSDPDFYTSVLLTLAFLLGSAIVGQNVLGMCVAVLMRHTPPSVSSAVGACIVGAWVMPEIVAAFACYAFFHTEGTLNRLLEVVGLEGPAWLVAFPMLSVILANIWRGTAFSMMNYNAALAQIPPEIKESAQIDGAGALQSFFRISLPIIRRTIATNLMLTTLQTLGVFTLIFVMTGGGPGTRSSILPVLAYQEAFKFSQIGYGSAIATVTLVIGALFSIVYARVLRPEVE